jgi:hypothetical protein
LAQRLREWWEAAEKYMDVFRIIFETFWNNKKKRPGG